jgi:TolB-like protein
MKMTASSDVYFFADFRFDRAGGGLFRRGDHGAFAPVPLGSRAHDLLAALIQRPGDVVSKEEIMAAVWPRLAVEEANLFVQISALRTILDKEQSGRSCIQTVTGRGYRFITPVTRCAEVMDSYTPPDRHNQFDVATVAKRKLPSLSLVVLPFANIGGDPDQEYFADGVTETLTTDLSRISGAFVIGRHTAFTYKGNAADVKQIGRELNVRYVLEGSVQRSGNRMRLNVQLVEAETGAHLWAERFDKPLADLFDMQDEIVSRLASQLQTELIDAEARRAERALNPDSTDLYFQARSLINWGLTPDILTRARALYERALDLDPCNVDALVGVAFVDLFVGISFTVDDPAPFLAAAETKLLKVLSTAPNHASAYRGFGLLLCLTNRAQRGVGELERALSIDPNSASAHALMGLARVYVGRAEETEAHVLEALRLSPRDPLAWNWFLYVGLARACLGDFAHALPWIRKSIDANRNNPWAFFHLAGSLAHLSLLGEARQELKAGLAVNPRFTIARFRAGMWSDNPVFLAQRERTIEGMRRAGVPEE